MLWKFWNFEHFLISTQESGHTIFYMYFKRCQYFYLTMLIFFSSSSSRMEEKSMVQGAGDFDVIPDTPRYVEISWTMKKIIHLLLSKWNHLRKLYINRSNTPIINVSSIFYVYISLKYHYHYCLKLLLFIHIVALLFDTW